MTYMTPSEYKDLFRGLAVSHVTLRHDEEGAQYPSGKRVSFFRTEEEVVQAQSTQIDSPYMVLPRHFGRMGSTDSNVVKNIGSGRFDIRTNVDNAQNFTAIDAAEDQCYSIAMDIVAKLMALHETEGYQGPMGYFNVNTVRYELIGGEYNAYGCRVYFEFQQTAFNTNQLDLTEKFT
jgi:hypothetical protein